MNKEKQAAIGTKPAWMRAEVMYLWSSEFAPFKCSTSNENVSPKKTHTNTHGSSIHNSQKVETTQMSINRYIKTVGYSENEILSSLKKEESACRRYNMDKSSAK